MKSTTLLCTVEVIAIEVSGIQISQAGSRLKRIEHECFAGCSAKKIRFPPSLEVLPVLNCWHLKKDWRHGQAKTGASEHILRPSFDSTALRMLFLLCNHWHLSWFQWNATVLKAVSSRRLRALRAIVFSFIVQKTLDPEIVVVFKWCLTKHIDPHIGMFFSFRQLGKKSHLGSHRRIKK
jgi:hypothetical protein